MTTLYETPLYNDGPNPTVSFVTKEHGDVVIDQTHDGDIILRASRENVDADTIAGILNDVATHDEFDAAAAEIAFDILAAAQAQEAGDGGGGDDVDDEADAEVSQDDQDDQDDETTTIELPDTTRTVEKGDRLRHTSLNRDMVVLGELRHSRVSIRAGSNDPEKWLKQDLRDKLADGTLQRVSPEADVG